LSGRLRDEDVEKAARLGFAWVTQGHFKIFKSLGRRYPDLQVAHQRFGRDSRAKDLGS